MSSTPTGQEVGGADLDGLHAFGVQREHGQLLVLPQSSVDLLEVQHVVGADEQQTETFFGGPGCSAAAVDVRLRRPGNLVDQRNHVT